MSRRAYAEIHLHITWHVKDNVAVLRDDIELQVHRYLRNRTRETPGAICHEVGGTDDHVHVVVSVQPELTPSEWIGQMKGASAHYINNLIANRKVLEWQPGYGIVSFGTKDLPWVVDYVRNQRAHHAQGKTHARLERVEAEEEGKPAQAGSEKKIKEE